ncbi:ATP-binding protein [Streptomyces sp. NPDC002476]|uniref:ATP-binding protein n=1 Tax=Streptomyces sp. NPDC002476 TaxID=3364648 RepID=UPI00367B299A
MNREITQPRVRDGKFAVQLSATRRGARLARLLATEQLRSWGLPLEDAGQVVAELASNAALHGHVPGRDFRISLTVDGDTLRIEVTDARGDVMPRVTEPDDASVAGRGLLIVEALSLRWGVREGPFPRKTVWADLALAGG